MDGPEIQELREAIKKSEKKRDKTLFEHFIERAFESDKVLIALMKKIIPDQKNSEIDYLEELPKIPSSYSEFVEAVTARTKEMKDSEVVA